MTNRDSEASATTRPKRSQLPWFVPRNPLSCLSPPLKRLTSQRRRNQALHAPKIPIAFRNVEFPPASKVNPLILTHIFDPKRKPEGRNSHPPPLLEPLPKNFSQPFHIPLFASGVLFEVHINVISCEADELAGYRFPAHEE